MYCARLTNFPVVRCPGFSSGIEWILCVSRDRGVIDVDDLQRSIAAHTRVLVTSSVQFATGFRQDLAALGRLCRERNLIFVVDATQGMGVFTIEVVASGIDFLVFSGYTWAA